jgi:hypothetical protein
MNWLDRKTEERVTMDVYGLASIIDFTKTVTFGGNTYYLDKNVITKDTKSLKQAVELVRWY